jgi:hypothetical protein
MRTFCCQSSRSSSKSSSSGGGCGDSDTNGRLVRSIGDDRPTVNASDLFRSCSDSRLIVMLLDRHNSRKASIENLQFEEIQKERAILRTGQRVTGKNFPDFGCFRATMANTLYLN